MGMVRNRRVVLRSILALVVIVSAAGIAIGYVSYTDDDVRTANSNSTVDRSAVDELTGPTVVTTAPRKSASGAIIAFKADGSVLYYNDTYDWYFDVDPVEGSNRTVEFVATELLPDEECPEELDGCHLEVVERVNLSTGERERIHTDFAAGSYPGWHDVDRINDTHVLVAGIREDRVFILNTSSDLITWQWDANVYFDPTSGGRFRNDWAHINDVELLPDGRIMVSARNQDRVLFLNRSGGVQPGWTLGSEDDYRTLYEQHNPDYIPRSQGGPAVVVSDSENNRVVEYRRTDNGSWKRVWGWRDASMQWPRDADRLPNGRTLVVDSDGNRVLELTTTGDVAWKFNIDTPYDAERLGSGPESSGGPSASRAGLAGKSVPVDSADRPSDNDTQGNEVSLGGALVLFLKRLLPRIVVNGFLYVLPPWVGLRELLFSLTLTGATTVWAGMELRWRGYRIRLPIERHLERR